MEWIPVTEDLPDLNDIVLVCDEFNDFVSIGKVIKDQDYYRFILMNVEKIEGDTEVTHWMPLPLSIGKYECSS